MGVYLRKINFLAIAVSLALFIFIVNAAEDRNDADNNVNDTYDKINADTEKSSSDNENISNNPKAVTASFGVYLEIVG